MPIYLTKITRAWLSILPPGEYTMKQLEEFSGKNRTNIYKVIKRIGLEKKLGKPIRANMVEVFYIWRGFEIETQDKGKP